MINVYVRFFVFLSKIMILMFVFLFLFFIVLDFGEIFSMVGFLMSYKIYYVKEVNMFFL